MGVVAAATLANRRLRRNEGHKHLTDPDVEDERYDSLVGVFLTAADRAIQSDSGRVRGMGLYPYLVGAHLPRDVEGRRDHRPPDTATPTIFMHVHLINKQLRPTPIKALQAIRDEQTAQQIAAIGDEQHIRGVIAEARGIRRFPLVIWEAGIDPAEKIGRHRMHPLDAQLFSHGFLHRSSMVPRIEHKRGREAQHKHIIKMLVFRRFQICLKISPLLNLSIVLCVLFTF